MSTIETISLRQPWEERAAELVRRLNTPEEDLNTDLLLELADLLPSEDGKPVENPWHRAAIGLLIEVLIFFWRDRDDFYVGGNMFVYYYRRGFPLPKNRGPDFFFVSGVERHLKRDKWAAFVEGKFPDVIVEFLSPTTASEDRTTKKDIYEEFFQTDEYFLYDPATHTLEGWTLKPANGHKEYEPIEANERGWMWSERLKLWLGPWTGEVQGLKDTWLRFYDAEGQLVLHGQEAEKQHAEDEKKHTDEEKKRADEEKKRADEEKKRADEAEAELARLRARLAELEQGQQHG